MQNKNLLLEGQCVLNTRPEHQQDELKLMLEAQGAEVISFPAIEIIDAEITDFRRSLTENIAHYNIALFISSNAVGGAFLHLEGDELPVDLKLGVIGEGTLRTLAEYVDNLDARLIHARPYNSEGFLAAPELQQVAGKNILIFRGQQGRNLLGDELRARGATVSYCEVYRRRIPEHDADYFAQLTEPQFPTLAVFTSNEGMHNVLDLVSAKSRLKLLNIPWLLISERMRESALNLGHNASIIIAANAGDEGIQQTINQWVREQAV